MSPAPSYVGEGGHNDLQPRPYLLACHNEYEEVQGVRDNFFP